MKYTINGKTFDKLPDPCNGVSPMTEARFTQIGGVILDEPNAFESACAQFRSLCSEIGKFVGDVEFKGGFDEYAEFASSESYTANPVKGNALAIQWSALNELCKYEGAKLGYGQPDWWYRCWELKN